MHFTGRVLQGVFDHRTPEAGDLVVIERFVNGRVPESGTGRMTTTTAADGTFSLDVDLGIRTPGSTDTATFHLSVMDAPGNFSMTEFSYRLDMSAPAVTINNTGRATNQQTQTISGTGEVGARIEVLVGSTVIGTTTVGTNGLWSTGVELPAQGLNTLRATARDAAGNTATTGNISFTLDTEPPHVVFFDDYDVSVNNRSQTLTGFSEAGATIRIYDNVVFDEHGGADFTGATLIGTGTVGSNSRFSVPVTLLPGEGVHNIAALGTDAAGNARQSPPIFYTLDVTLPAVAITTAPNGGLTNQPTHTIDGTAEAGAVVAVFDGATQLNAVTVGGDGIWSMQVALPADGVRRLVAKATDAAGNVATSAERVEYTLDTVAPAAALTTPGGLYNTATMNIDGTGEPGSVVSIWLDGEVNGVTRVVGADGTWRRGLGFGADGEHQVYIKVTDAAGNVGTSETRTFTIDTVAPVVTITTTARRTNQAEQTITGTGEAGTTITILDGVATLDTTVVADDGTWSKLVTLVGDRVHRISARDVDAAGNAATSASVPLTLDTVAPAVAITSAGGPTRLVSQTITGTGEAGAKVTVFDGDTAFAGVVTVAANGTWSKTVTLSGEGAHAISASAVDLAGNVGEATPVAFALDTIVPVVAIATIGGATNQPGLTLTGTGEAGSTVVILDGASDLGSTTVAEDGSWTKTVTLSGDGSHTLTAVDTDAAGNTATSAGVAFLLDTLAPAVAIANPGGLTNQASQTFTGTGEAGVTVALFDGALALGTTTVADDGTWSRLAVLDGQGAHSITARATDAVGNSTTTAPLAFTLDSIAPALAILTPGVLTRVAGQTIIGTGEAGATVTLFDGTTEIGSLTIGGSGTWVTPVTLVGDGLHAITARGTDAAGNATTTPPVTFTFDTTAPLVAITSPALRTNQPTQTITGTGEAGTPITILDGAATIGTTVVADDGTWSKLVTLVGDGVHRISARDVDAAGNAATSTRVNITLDTVAPAVAITSAGVLTNMASQTITGTGEAGARVVVFDGITAFAGAVTIAADGTWSKAITLVGQGGHAITAQATDRANNTTTTAAANYTFDTIAPLVAVTSAGGLTNRPGQTITGTGEANTTLAVFDGANLLDTVTVGGTGRWSSIVTLTGDGLHSITARDTDAAGNSATSAAVSYTLDTAAPTVAVITTGGPTNKASQTITGTGEPGATVTLFDDGTPIAGSVTIAADGSWSKVITLSGEGDHAITAQARDAAGNVTTATTAATFGFDITAPVVEASTSGGTINEAAQTIEGTGEAGTTIRIVDGTVELGATVVDADGNWAQAVTLTGDGSHRLTVFSTDIAGNVGFDRVNFTLDTVAPLVVLSSTGGLVNRATQTITGTAEAGASVLLFDGGVPISTAAKVAADGTWRKTITLIGQGDHLISAAAFDRAGNVGPDSATATFTLDTIAPAATIIPTGGLTRHASQTVSGTGEIGATVVVRDGTLALGNTTVGAGGTWSLVVGLGADGAHSLNARVTDAAGNARITGSVGYTLDTRAPAVAITSAGIPTSQASQTITGTGEVGARVTLYDGADAIAGIITIGASGSWSKAITLSGQGDHAITAQASDAAGNIGTSAAITFGYDTVTPVVVVTSPLGPTIQPVQTMTGTAEAHSQVAVWKGTTQLGTGTADAAGAWSIDVTLPAAGSHSLVVKATDAAGNTGSSAAAVLRLFVADATGRLTVSADEDVVDADFTGLTGLTSLVFSGSGDSSAVLGSAAAAAFGNAISVRANSAVDSLLVDGSALGAGTTLVGRGAGGNDSFVGGAGNDTFIGGAGADLFDLSEGGRDVINDFDIANDVIRLAGLGIADFAALAGAISYAGGRAVIAIDAGHHITLLATAAGSLSANDFLFS